jgi:hypothetical protein
MEFEEFLKKNHKLESGQKAKSEFCKTIRQQISKHVSLWNL